MNEFDLIERFFVRPSSRNDVAIGIGDDAAVCNIPPDHQLVMTTDMLVAGTHFPEDAPADAIGHKALAVNLSDLAAMGANPSWFTLNLSLPEVDERWLRSFSSGLFALAESHNITLVGGDTVKGPLSAAIQVCGLIPESAAVLRSGAQAGDQIFVTGSIGDAAAGLGCLQQHIKLPEKARDYFVSRLHYPVPRVAEGVALREVASAMIDISDGLLADLGHVLDCSGVGATVRQDDLPLSPNYRDNIAELGLAFALSGGDDYELCFTVRADKVSRLYEISEKWACAITPIGEIESSTGLRLRDKSGELKEFDKSGYNHFAES